MGVYTDIMFNNQGAAVTALTQLNSGVGTTAGTYSPQLNGRLMKIDIFNTPQAATSLCEAGYIQLSQTNWKPNILRFSFGGYGLQTVSTGPVLGNITQFSYVVDQPVQTDWPITGQHIEFFSPVTPGLWIVGTFSA